MEGGLAEVDLLEFSLVVDFFEFPDKVDDKLMRME
jgi:hypothetical protein